MTDQHSDPIQQHSPYLPVPQQYSDPTGYQAFHLAEMSGSTPSAGPRSRRRLSDNVVASPFRSGDGQGRTEAQCPG